MALVILFGLARPTVLNMIVVPVLYARFGRPVRAGPDEGDPRRSRVGVRLSAFAPGAEVRLVLMTDGEPVEWRWSADTQSGLK